MAFLEKINFTQPALMNDFYYFFQGEVYFAHRLWKIVAALSLSHPSLLIDVRLKGHLHCYKLDQIF